MNKRLKQVLAAGLMVLGLGFGREVWAGVGTPDTMTVSVTPGNMQFGVTITSGTLNEGYNFGTVDLAASSVSTTAIVVTNAGSMSEYFAMKIGNSSPDNWQPVTGGTPGQDRFKLVAELGPNQPADSGVGFPDADAMDGGDHASGALFGQGGLGKTGPGNSRNLWLRITMPNDVTNPVQTAQSMTLTVTGRAD